MKELYDASKIEADNLMEPVYRMDENGNYSIRVGYDYLPKDELMCHEFWKVTNAKLDKLREEIREGKHSPVYFQMVRNFMDPFAFSRFVGIPVWKVKRHCTPRGFARIKPDMIRRYAEALEISETDILNLK